MKKIALLLIILIGVLGGVLKVQRAGAQSPIYIRPNGMVEGTDKIIQNGNLYTFNESISNEIVVEKSDIVIDGDGYTLQGVDEGIGFNLTNLSNVTVKSVNIENFLHGIYIHTSFNNTISGNNIRYNSLDGVRLVSSSNNHISENNITDNSFYGIYFNMSSFSTISRNDLVGNYYGFWSTLSFNNSISENAITDNNEYGIWLRSSVNNTVLSNVITRNNNGLYLSSSSNSNNISYNDITNNNYGFRVRESGSNIAFGNSIRDNNNYGIYFDRLSKVLLRNNTLSDNSYNFAIFGLALAHFIVDIDESNLVNSKPIYYLINQRNAEIPSDAGYVAIVNSSGITANGLNLAYNSQGVLLVNSNNSLIKQNNIVKNEIGIQFYSSFNNSIYGNDIRDNTIYGLGLVASSNNSIYQNNFINNVEQIGMASALANTWSTNYPSGGNYWDNFVSNDLYRGPSQNKTGSDGISDTPFVINIDNQDAYPLEGPINFFDAGTWNETLYIVKIISNSTLSDFYFDPDEVVKHFRFNASGLDGSVGFCRVSFSAELLEGPYAVTVNGNPARITTGTTNNSHIFLYFAYNHTTKIVRIIGTEAIPELLPMALFSFFLITTLILIFRHKRKFPRDKGKKEIVQVKSSQVVSSSCICMHAHA